MPCLFHCENLCNIGNPTIPPPHPHNQRMPQGEEVNPTHRLYIVGACQGGIYDGRGHHYVSISRQLRRRSHQNYSHSVR